MSGIPKATITISVSDGDASDPKITFFKLKPNTPFSKVYKAYGKQSNLVPALFRLMLGLFAVAFPLAPLLSLINNSMQIPFEIISLASVTHRPLSTLNTEETPDADTMGQTYMEKCLLC